MAMVDRSGWKDRHVRHVRRSNTLQRESLAAGNLAARLLSEAWSLQAIAAAIDVNMTVGYRRSRTAFAVRVFALGEATYPRAPHLLAHCLRQSEFFKPDPARVVPATLDPPRFAPIPPFAGLPIPTATTLGELGEGLGLAPEQLDWLSDERRGHGRARTASLQHYRYALVSKTSGAFCTRYWTTCRYMQKRMALSRVGLA
jgi:hypothetical protein